MELVRMEKVTKTYPRTAVPSAMDFTFHEQRIVSLPGENGAGETTLTKILYGMTSQSSSKIFYRRRPIQLYKSVDTIERGIYMVH